MKLGIVGGGTVGRATARAFLEHAEEVRVYDIVPERRTHGLIDVLACDLIFVCLPTPTGPKGELDVSAVEAFFAGAQEATTYTDRRTVPIYCNFVLRSTVPIGTTRRLAEKYGLPNLVHSPEFLTARCAVTDAQLPARNIIGVPDEPFAGEWEFTGLEKHPGRAEKIYEFLYLLYRRRFPGVPVYVMSSDESEAVKLFQNSFFAVKVAFWNECHTLAAKLNLDWNRVLEAILADGRIARAHTKVPGPDGKFGFGPDTPDACLPKDLSGLVHQLREAGLLHAVTNGALTRNILDRERTT